MKFILGKKIGNTQIFDENNNIVPVTVIETPPLTVLGLRSKEKDGYNAVIVGAGVKKRINKPQKGFFKDLGSFKIVKEFKSNKDYKIGSRIDVSIFQIGDIVDVTGYSKGRGFQGVVKRHGFAGGPKSHGHKHNLRAPGSIGSTTPEHVIKGKKMPGHMGAKRVTVKNLKIVGIDLENNLLLIKGAVPGYKGSFVEIKSKDKLQN